MKIIFNDGTEEVFERANIENSEESDNFYLIKDGDEDIIAEININSIKLIKWVI